MILLDTHAWIWWADAPSKLSPAAARAIAAEQRIGIAAISCWECGVLIAKGRIRFDRPLRDWFRQALSLPGAELLPLTPDVASRAVELGGAFHGDPADRIIVATAIEESVSLVTKDHRIRHYPAVTTIW